MLFARRAWDVHWACMYPLLANYLGFLGLCRELGLDSQGVARLFQGYETQITATDRGLWQLAVAARGAGLEALFADTPAEHLRQAIQGTGTGARAWREDLERFLARHGWRTEGIYDVSLAPWTEDPTPALGTIKTLLATEVEHDFDAARDAAARERDALVADARARLTVEERAAFDAGLRAGRHANFAWWNEEHNVYIDLRTHIPLRRLALGVGRLFGAERPDDACFLFAAELRGLLAGRRTWASLAPLVAERRRFHAEWEARRATMPKLLGTMPDEVNDPVLREIFGVSPQFLAAIERRDEALGELTGLPASPGVARGRARVLLSAEELHAVEAGEVLVCEATSPNWTPAFTKIAACVCDAGGSLTHAAIVSREYRVPCVTGCAIATATIATGDLVEVDGSAGRVRILERAPRGDEALVA
jgi:pyruvate,water dikinase